MVIKAPAFEACFKIILRLEGVGVSAKNPDGYVNHPKDPGGETKFGICKKSYPHLDIRALTLEKALDIYRRDFWKPSGAEKLTWPINCIVADAAVNMGVGRAKQILVLVGPHPAEYLLARRQRYQYIADHNPAAAYWLEAWFNRLTALKEAIGV